MKNTAHFFVVIVSILKFLPNIHDQGLSSVFNDVDANKMIKLIDQITRNVVLLSSAEIDFLRLKSKQ